MSWRVIKEFADKTDNYHVYKAGDLFPRDGKQVDEVRLKELSTQYNAQKTPLIKEADERKATAEESAEKPKKGSKSKVKE